MNVVLSLMRRSLRMRGTLTSGCTSCGGSIPAACRVDPYFHVSLFMCVFIGRTDYFCSLDVKSCFLFTIK